MEEHAASGRPAPKYFLRSKTIGGFRAAGVLPLAVHNQRTYVLLGAEQGRLWAAQTGTTLLCKKGGREKYTADLCLTVQQTWSLSVLLTVLVGILGVVSGGPIHACVGWCTSPGGDFGGKREALDEEDAATTASRCAPAAVT